MLRKHGGKKRMPARSLWLAAAVALGATTILALSDWSPAQSRRSSVEFRGAADSEPNARMPASTTARPMAVSTLRVRHTAQLPAPPAAEQDAPVPIQPLVEPSAEALRARRSGRSGELGLYQDGSFEVPLAGANPEAIELNEQDGRISLVVRNGILYDVVTALAESQGLNVVTAEGLNVPLTISLDRVPLEVALDAVLSTAGFTWVISKHDIIYITSLANARSVSPRLQGRRFEVFQLDYAAADDVNTIVSGMLSNVGQSFAMISDVADNRRSREVLVVEDLPEYLDRIREQIAMIDQPPRQVLVQVYILQITLDDEHRHGVNLAHEFNLSSNLVQLETIGFGNPNAAQAAFFNVSGGNLTNLVELLQTTTDSKTLASPKLLCLNGQTSRIQVGEQLGFRVTTTTETSTTESVEFLDVGVVLEVTPRISRDGRVMMRIRPEVSSGEVSANTGLPEEATTELETDVLLGDNQGVVIGGLIQEIDGDTQSKVPFIGDLHLLGKLFQRSERRKSRSEIVIALLPRVVPFAPPYQDETNFEAMRAQTPLLYGPLIRNERPWEATLPDASRNPVYLRLPPVFAPPDCPHCSGAGCPLCRTDAGPTQPRSIARTGRPAPIRDSRESTDPAAITARRTESGSIAVASRPGAPVRRLPPVEKIVPGDVLTNGNMLR